MKLVMKILSLSLRSGGVAALLLVSQQSMAVGTAAGSTISNEATVDYSVGAVGQTPITSAPATFIVDNRVDFTLVQSGNLGRTIVTPGQVDNWVEFTLMNTGNQTQDYQLAPTALLTPDFQMLLPRAFAETDGIPGWTVADSDLFVDSLAPDASIVVYVVANAPVGPADTDLSDVELLATTADAGSGGLVVTTATAGPDTPGEDVVLAVAGNNGQGDLTATDGYIVETVLLGVTKGSTLISDPFSVAPDGPFAIPGAVVRYTIDVANPSAITSVTAVQIDDTLNDVAITAGDTITLTNGVLGGVPAASCSADLGDADTDGCGLVQVTPTQQDLEVGNANADFTIAPATTLTIEFDTTIL